MRITLRAALLLLIAVLGGGVASQPCQAQSSSSVNEFGSLFGKKQVNMQNRVVGRAVVRKSTIYGPVTQNIYITADQRRFRRSFNTRTLGLFSRVNSSSYRRTME